MSEQLAAAAAAMGIPEPLVERSAAARAAEGGASVEDILAAWSGGAAAPAPPDTEPSPEPAEEAAEEEVAEEAPEEEATPEIVIEAPVEEPEPEPEPAAAAPYRPPVLVGASDNPMLVLAAGVGLFVLVLLVGLVGPASQGDALGARTSTIGYSELAVEGRKVYASSNCQSCHTQMVRPVIADVGLGSVTLHDTNQVLGTRRFGPDLSDVGSRMSRDDLAAIITGGGDHPEYGLSAEDMERLVSYLAESRTSEAS